MLGLWCAVIWDLGKYIFKKHYMKKNFYKIMCLFFRHPEELSLCKPLDPEHLKQNYQVTPTPFCFNSRILLNGGKCLGGHDAKTTTGSN